MVFSFRLCYLAFNPIQSRRGCSSNNILNSLHDSNNKKREKKQEEKLPNNKNDFMKPNWKIDDSNMNWCKPSRTPIRNYWTKNKNYILRIDKSNNFNKVSFT